ncbi:hypothetical protein NXY56_006995 [Leishmania guyanensis]
MGAGSSTASAGDAGVPLPTCPLFYNFMPNAQLIPASTLPTRGPDGLLCHPQGGCMARVIQLRSLPVVSEDSKRCAAQIIADAKKKKKRGGDSTADREEANAVAAANDLLRNPSLHPSLSSCFLLSIAVDEQGRLVPLSTGDEHGVNAMAGGGGDGAQLATSKMSEKLTSPRSKIVKKGFSFSVFSSTVRTPLVLGEGGSCEDSVAGTPRPLRGGNNGAAATKLVSVLSPVHASVNAGSHPAGDALLPDPPSPHRSEAMPRWRSPTSDSGGDGAQLASSKRPKGLTSSFASPPPSSAGSSNAACDTTIEEKQGTPLVTIPMCSVLAKQSHFRKLEEGQGRESTSVASVLPNVGATGGDGVIPPRIRRQLSRITLLRVPQRTRWFLFNDSRTHEAQVSALLCYRAEEKPTYQKNLIPGEETPMDSSGRTITAATPVPGDLRICCRPTPLSHTSLSSKEMKLQLQSMCSSTRSYVEVQPMAVEVLTAAIPAPKTPMEEEKLAEFKKRASGAAAVEVFVVLAPGATVYLAEGEVLGYKIDTHLVPFDKLASIAVLGRMLTPELVRNLKKKGESVNVKGYRHKLMFLAKPTETTAGAASAHGSSLAPACLTGSAMAPPPTAAARGTPKDANFIPPLSSDTPNVSPPDLGRSTISVTSATALTDSAGHAADATVAAAKTSAAPYWNRLSLQRRCKTAEKSPNDENHSEGAGNPSSYNAPAAAAAVLAWPAADTTATRAGEMGNAAGVLELPVLGIKSLIDDLDKECSIPRSHAPLEGGQLYSTSTSSLHISF